MRAGAIILWNAGNQGDRMNARWMSPKSGTLTVGALASLQAGLPALRSTARYVRGYYEGYEMTSVQLPRALAAPTEKFLVRCQHDRPLGSERERVPGLLLRVSQIPMGSVRSRRQLIIAQPIGSSNLSQSPCNTTLSWSARAGKIHRASVLMGCAATARGRLNIYSHYII